MGYSCYHRWAASDAEGWDALWLPAPCGKSHWACAPVHSPRERAAPDSGYLQCFHLVGRTSTWSCHISQALLTGLQKMSLQGGSPVGPTFALFLSIPSHHTKASCSAAPISEIALQTAVLQRNPSSMGAGMLNGIAAYGCVYWNDSAVDRGLKTPARSHKADGTVPCNNTVCCRYLPAEAEVRIALHSKDSLVLRRTSVADSHAYA